MRQNRWLRRTVDACDGWRLRTDAANFQNVHPPLCWTDTSCGCVQHSPIVESNFLPVESIIHWLWFFQKRFRRFDIFKRFFNNSFKIGSFKCLKSFDEPWNSVSNFEMISRFFKVWSSEMIKRSESLEFGWNLPVQRMKREPRIVFCFRYCHQQRPCELFAPLGPKILSDFLLYLWSFLLDREFLFNVNQTNWWFHSKFIGVISFLLPSGARTASVNCFNGVLMSMKSVTTRSTKALWILSLSSSSFCDSSLTGIKSIHK